jgi:hypothetical protein
MGAQYLIGIDGISLLLIMLTTLHRLHRHPVFVERGPGPR